MKQLKLLKIVNLKVYSKKERQRRIKNRISRNNKIKKKLSRLKKIISRKSMKM